MIEETEPERGSHSKMEARISPQMSVMDKLKILADAVQAVHRAEMTARASATRWRQGYVIVLAPMADVFLY